MQISDLFLCMVFLIGLLTDLSLLKGFLKNVSFEDFHNFHEMFPKGGHELAFLLL